MIGVVYICRGADPNFEARLTRFIDSWLAYPPGIPCTLYITFKEFADYSKLLWAMSEVAKVPDVVSIYDYIRFNSYGGGCFQEACAHVKEQTLCTLVSTTQIMHHHWLLKLWAQYDHDVGLVGCTGSKEGNLHIRDTAILVNRDFYLHVSRQFDFKKSKDGYLDFEHGPNNLTIQVMRDGKKVLVVEKRRIIEPAEWGHTTYRGNLANVLVHDRGARDFQDL